MAEKETNKKISRAFKPTLLALKNRNTIFLLTLVLAVFGFYFYRNMPKELFPEVSIPTVLVQTIYPGNPPVDIENIITRPIEKELEDIDGITEIRSISAQDASIVTVSFDYNKDIDKAVDQIKDAVDKAKNELPDDLPKDPMVMDIDFDEFPIINVNLSGNYSITELNNFAELLQDEIEAINAVSEVKITGIGEREVKIDVDLQKMEAKGIAFNEIENAIRFENIAVAAGEILMPDKTTRTVRTGREFKNVKEISDLLIKSNQGAPVYLKDIASVEFGFEKRKSFARLNKETVVSLQVIKKSGENLLETIDQIIQILEEHKKNQKIPPDLNVTVTNDQSDIIRNQLSSLENSMIFAVMLVIFVLYLFLGLRNALFVGLSIPLSMFLSFLILGLLGNSLNMMVLFALILSLGMLVDNAIVIVDNIYRFIENGYSVFKAARLATGEIAFPIITSTLTTITAFAPLAFWNSGSGEFMKDIPITLMITLGSSLFVSLVIIPVFSSAFVKINKEKGSKKKRWIVLIIVVLVAIIFYFSGSIAFGNILLLLLIIALLNFLFFNRLSDWFQNKFLLHLENWYAKSLAFLLKGKHALILIIGTILLLIITVFMFRFFAPDIRLFPDNEPRYINIIAELPIGMDVTGTDSVIMEIEKDLYQFIEPYKPIIESVHTIVGEGAKSQEEQGREETPNKALITITFLPFEERGDLKSSDLMRLLSKKLTGQYPGIVFSLEKNRQGPVTGKAVSIEITGNDLDKLIFVSDTMRYIIESSAIDGLGAMKTDLERGKPELVFDIDSEKARKFGLSSFMIAATLRTSLFGKDISDFKSGNEEYPIMLRYDEQYRNDPAALLNQKIPVINASGFGSPVPEYIPIASLASVKYGSTYNSIKRKDLKRVVTLSANVIEGYNANNINQEIKRVLSDLQMPDGYQYVFAGEQEEQQDSMAFLMVAMILAISVIAIILVSQFNSVVKPFIIISSIIFSTIGVLLGIIIFQLDFVIIMTGIGIIALAGIVVNNAIVMVDYIDLLRNSKKKELNYAENKSLDPDLSVKCIVEAGKTRLRPVLLTATTTIIGLMPLAIGLNIDFEGFFTAFKPNIYFGGDSTSYWSPISSAIIFGLTVATFLTLFVVPAFYHLLHKAKLGIIRLRKNKTFKKLL